MHCRLVLMVKAYGKCRIVARDTGSVPTLAFNSSVGRTPTIFPKKGVLPLFAPIRSKMCKLGKVQTGRTLGQNSTCSCLITCLRLLSHNRQTLTRAIQNSRMERNFGVLVDSSNTTGRNQINFFIVSLFS